MPRPPDLSPRKTPRQERSRQMVERILDAATRVLSERGYDGASTNHIAGTAGISNGSLYQYFPNKDAIVVPVLDSSADHLASRIGAQIEATCRDRGRRAAGRCWTPRSSCSTSIPTCCASSP